MGLGACRTNGLIGGGAAVGADAYIVKGRFDQHDLLQTVGRLL